MKILLSLFVLVFLVLTSTTVFADPPVFLQQPDQAPIDGGLSLLAAAGGAYAIKKLRDKRNTNID